MIAQKALIAWNAPEYDRGPDDPAATLPPVIVIEKSDPFPEGWSYGYKSANGACCADWRAANDADAVLNILILFRRLVLQGIPAHEVHRAFFEIEEYRRASRLQISLNGDEFNP